jgi:hypothetical protein
VYVVDQKYQVLQMYLMTMSTMNKWSVTLHGRLANATVLIEEYRLESSSPKIQDTLLLGVTGKWVHVA